MGGAHSKVVCPHSYVGPGGMGSHHKDAVLFATTGGRTLRHGWAIEGRLVVDVKDCEMVPRAEGVALGVRFWVLLEGLETKGLTGARRPVSLQKTESHHAPTRRKLKRAI